MKLARHDYDVDHNIGQLSTFKVAQNAAMFDILAGLYTDPIEAIVRENCTNAFEVGHFRVAMPTALEPILVIQDDGPGMDHEFMMDGYAQAGFSTKTNDENTPGGFGIGRLSSLAYVDRYDVTTQGRAYSIFRNANGLPTVAYLGEAEGEGTTIRVPVKRSDFIDFEMAIQRVLKWFPPESYETFGVEVEPVKAHAETPSYKQLSRALDDNYVLMGPIAYKIDWRRIGAELPDTVVPLCKVGELDLPPSREEIKYTERTIATMRRMYDAIIADLPPRVLRAAVNLSPRERLELKDNLNRTHGMYKIFDEYHKRMGHRAKDKALSFDKQKWGSYLLRSHEYWTVYDKPVRVYEAAGRRGKSLLSSKSRTLSTLEFPSTSFLGKSIFFIDDVDGKQVRDRIEASGRQASTYYVVGEDFQAPDGAQVDRLSNYTPPPKASKHRNLKHFVRDGWYWTEAHGLPTSGVWAPFDRDFCLMSTWCDLDLAREVPLYGFNKTAQNALKLQNFERIDTYIHRRVAEILPRAADAMAAAEYLAAFQHPLKQHVELFPNLQAALAEVEAIRDQLTPAERTAIAFVRAKPKKSRKKFSLEKVFDRTAKKNPVLTLLLPRVDYLSEELANQLKEIVKC